MVVTVNGKPAFELLPVRDDDPDFIDRMIEENDAFAELLEPASGGGSGPCVHDRGDSPAPRLSGGRASRTVRAMGEAVRRRFAESGAMGLMEAE